MAEVIDLIVIALYLLATVYIGIKSSKRENLEGYLANNRKTKLWFLTFSNVSTLVGAGAVIAVASSAYTTGISYGLVVAVSLTVAAILFALLSKKIKTFGDQNKAYTVGDFFEYRFGKSNRYVFAVLFVILAFLWGAIQFVAIAQLLKSLTGTGFLAALILSAIVTIIYTSIAGLISDIMTDFLQFWVMLATFVILLPLAWVKAGGFTALKSLPSVYFDPFAFGGVSFLVGGIILSGLVLIPSVHYWQRIYSAESVKTSRKSFLFSIPGVLFFVGASVLAGLFAAIIIPGVNPDSSLFDLMKNILPTGLLGLGFAGIIAVVMSSIDSLLLGGSATLLKDLYMPFFHPKMHERELLNMARYITAIFGMICAMVAFIFQDIIQLSILTAFTALCFVPSTIGGLFWKRTTMKGSIASLLSALVVLYALIGVMPKTAFLPSFVVGTLVLIIVSLLTKHSESENFI